MSLFGSLFSGVSGLTAQSSSLAMISDNIANVSTNGYKRAVADFSDLVTNAASRSTYNSGGVSAKTTYEMEDQGLITASTSATSVAITGGGFFTVNTNKDGSGEQLYTRDGSFTKDANGYLITTSGDYVQGWKLDADGNVIDQSKLTTISVADTVGLAQATTSVEVNGNLNAEVDINAAAADGTLATGDLAAYMASGGTIAGSVKPDVTQNVTIYDSLGRAQTVTMAFVKTGTNTWHVEIAGDPDEVDTTVQPNGLLASGTIEFNTDGTFKASALEDASGTPITGTSVPITWAAENGASVSNITFDLGDAGTTSGMTQLATASGFTSLDQNGSPTGQLSGLSIDKDGYVIASFTNGTTSALYQIPIATFANPGGLEPRSGNLYAGSETSGNVYFRAAGEGGAGTLATSSVEASNVDIADEFSKMIVTQRAYSANTKVISTANEMLQDLLQLK